LPKLDSIEPTPGSETVVNLRGSGWQLDANSDAEPVRDVLIQIDLFDLLSRAVAVGDDLTFFGCCGSPSVLFDGIPLDFQG
jgi:predicted Zn-dependent protease